MFGVVVLWVVCNACGLGEKAGIVGKVECAGKEATLLEDVGDVAKRTSMSCVDVGHLTGVVDLARVAGGGKLRVAFWTRLGMVMQWYW